MTRLYFPFHFKQQVNRVEDGDEQSAFSIQSNIVALIFFSKLKNASKFRHAQRFTQTELKFVIDFKGVGRNVQDDLTGMWWSRFAEEHHLFSGIVAGGNNNSETNSNYFICVSDDVYRKKKSGVSESIHPTDRHEFPFLFLPPPKKIFKCTFISFYLL